MISSTCLRNVKCLKDLGRVNVTLRNGINPNCSALARATCFSGQGRVFSTADSLPDLTKSRDKLKAEYDVVVVGAGELY